MFCTLCRLLQMEEALQQNETVNIFEDVFKALGPSGEEDGVQVGVSKKGENELKVCIYISEESQL